jgi:transcriptional regulator with XRE-family HTH domain
MSNTGYSLFMEGRQIKAARAILGLSQAELCEFAGISRATLIDLENDTGDPRRSSIAGVEEALRKRGIAFTDDGKSIGVLAPKLQRKG